VVVVETHREWYDGEGNKGLGEETGEESGIIGIDNRADCNG
jgi:hypothetical protein